MASLTPHQLEILGRIVRERVKGFLPSWTDIDNLIASVAQLLDDLGDTTVSPKAHDEPISHPGARILSKYAHTCVDRPNLPCRDTNPERCFVFALALRTFAAAFDALVAPSLPLLRRRQTLGIGFKR